MFIRNDELPYYEAHMITDKEITRMDGFSTPSSGELPGMTPQDEQHRGP